MITILLVDDNLTFLEVLAYFLKSKNVYVITSSSFDEALDIIKKIKFDLIISDYIIGDDNGLSILKFLRINNDLVKFIMLTGCDDRNLKDKVKKLNGIFLDKLDNNLIKNIKEEILKRLGGLK